jgi:hypothetical protein
MAEAFHTLPYYGGLFDQPGEAIFRMEAVLDARAEKERTEMEKSEAKARLEEKVKSLGV